MRRTTRSTRSGSRVLTDPAISEISGARTTRARCARSRPGVLIAECGSQATTAPYQDTAMHETVHEIYSGSSVSQGGRRGQTRPDRPPAPGRAAEHPAGRVGDVGPPAPTGPGIWGWLSRHCTRRLSGLGPAPPRRRRAPWWYARRWPGAPGPGRACGHRSRGSAGTAARPAKAPTVARRGAEQPWSSIQMRTGSAPGDHVGVKARDPSGGPCLPVHLSHSYCCPAADRARRAAPRPVP